jgi:hypothetical protein
MKSAFLSLLALAISTSVFSQLPDKNFPDSVSITIHPNYNQISKIHRKIFGKNYRQEWATAVKLPLIRISRINGGLSPERYGGGMETKSIRLSDKSGQEWVLRSVEKIPDKLVPENLRQTFALDWVDDAYSGQHPYSALMVPPLAEAVDVPHSNPVIGALEADPALGTFSTQFAGRVVLFEERESSGASDNTQKMMKETNGNYNVRLDGKEILRARMLDLLIGDWDRHEDQWRWHMVKNENGKVYIAVPRDRDQVLHVVQGLLPGNVWMPLATGPINRDDDFLLGLGFRYTGNTGFRKVPNSTIQELMITHSFKNEAFRVNYSGEWMSVIGKADFTLAARADAPDNTMNFFGKGNATPLVETGDYHRFYRARFDFNQLDAALRWHIGQKTTLSAVPSLQYYHYNENDKIGRSITTTGLIKSYDSTSYRYDKTHAGLAVRLISDHRNNTILPSSGWLLQVDATAYTGLNQSSRAYAQLKPEIAYFLKADTGGRLVFSDRIGAVSLPECSLLSVDVSWRTRQLTRIPAKSVRRTANGL